MMIPYFASMVRDFNSSHSEFLPRAMNSVFPNLEAYICFWIGDTTFFITYLESWLKDDSGQIPEYFLRCSRVGLFGKSSEKMASYHWQPTVLFEKKQSNTTTTTIKKVTYFTKSHWCAYHYVDLKELILNMYKFLYCNLSFGKYRKITGLLV